jgi:hypothetical protein
MSLFSVAHQILALIFRLFEKAGSRVVPHLIKHPLS